MKWAAPTILLLSCAVNLFPLDHDWGDGATGDPYVLEEVAERHPDRFQRIFMSGRFVLFERRVVP